MCPWTAESHHLIVLGRTLSCPEPRGVRHAHQSEPGIQWWWHACHHHRDQLVRHDRGALRHPVGHLGHQRLPDAGHRCLSVR
ncbi:hypothetical protein SGPA1_12790 [Streptomyces misionensis JCM 4497]